MAGANAIRPRRRSFWLSGGWLFRHRAPLGVYGKIWKFALTPPNIRAKKKGLETAQKIKSRFVMWIKKINDEIYDEESGFVRVNVGDEVDPMWGYDEYTLSRGDVEHLLAGGCLYFSDGEYAHIFAMKREDL